MSNRHITQLRSLLRENRPRVAVETHGVYPMLGVYGFGRGVILREAVRGHSISAQHLYRVAAGQIVYSRLKAFEGAFALVPPEAGGRLVTNEFPAFNVASDVVIPEYLSLVLGQPSAWHALATRSTGVGARRERLQVDDFLDFEIDLPSLQEQAAAVEAAGHLRLLADATRAQALAARKLLESLWSQTWMDELVAVAPQRVADVTEVSSGGTPSRRRPDYFHGDIPWVKTGEVVFNELAETHEHITAAAVAESSAKLLPAGTVVVAMYGQGATRGRCAILTREMATNQACAGIRPCDALVPRYLFYWLWWSYERIRDEAEGSSQPNLNKKIVEDLALPIPSTEQQLDIVERLDVALRCERALITEALAADELRRATIAGLLSGQLRVDQSMESAAA